MGTKVWCQTSGEGETSTAVRLFKSKKAAFASGEAVWFVSRTWAVSSIRHQIWLRCRGACEKCTAPVNENSGEMHEKKHRGKGGEISIDNSIFICRECHQHEHRERNPRWSK